MKTYTIEGKEYSEFEIKVRCAEIKTKNTGQSVSCHHGMVFIDNHFCGQTEYDPCNNPADTWPIVEKIQPDLFDLVDGKGVATYAVDSHYTKWEYLSEKYNCSMLTAACICFIEMNEFK